MQRRLRDAAPELAQATCLAIACPACMTLELARSCAPYVTTIVNNADIVPTISPGAPSCISVWRQALEVLAARRLHMCGCPVAVHSHTRQRDVALQHLTCVPDVLMGVHAAQAGSADALREEVVQSAWYEAFRADMRSSAVVRAVESSLGRVGAASVWTRARLASASSSLTCDLRPAGHCHWCMLGVGEESCGATIAPLKGVCWYARPAHTHADSLPVHGSGSLAACQQDSRLRRTCYQRRAPGQGKRRSSDDRGGAAAKDSDDEAGAPRAGAGGGAAGSDVSMGVEVASDWVASEAQVVLQSQV